ncbi:S-adenosyl-l-methionine hydroxide adenosyltransferase [Halovenus sp. WSH3]|uniref:S-adenosyl-l-methionine hydroxide adenosyltransferase n=1 Tax=Halovenus carboxidivorans TaxID=2692199 RepID=A0A6B0T855_9EURY|nr:SAM-dependent chlorinase/fluorinase [Halovenus carboxidivorans]MXR51080.1 S-adenosyl-l-methionine hydroxide adenosyltransferase [Halovenus carboxidivorans]
MITLSSDFGSPYPAAMKGVISQWTDARLIDVSHDLPRQDLRQSAFWLRETLPYFPPAVHLAVIDPGVGTDRDAVVIRAGGHALVGPDNGVLLPAARALGGESVEIFRVETRDETAEGTDRTHWPPRLASSTFHGRDVFAPTAARVHEIGTDGLDDDDAFTRHDGYESLRFPEPVVSESAATGTILAVDDFGNAISNVPASFVDGAFGGAIQVNDETAPLARSYAHVEAGQRLVTVGSHGNLELAVNQGRGTDAFGLDAGDDVHFALGSRS